MTFLLDFSHRNSNATQWAIGKRQFNENPKEVREIFDNQSKEILFFSSGLSLAGRE